MLSEFQSKGLIRKNFAIFTGYNSRNQTRLKSGGRRIEKMTMIVVLFAVGLVGGVVGKVIPESAERTPYSLEEILSARKPEGLAYKWISANEIVYQNGTKGDIWVNNFNRSKVLVAGSILEKYNAYSFDFSPNNNYLLLGHSVNKVFRHSTTRKYVVYSLIDKTYTDVAKNADLQLASWVPNSSRLLYIKDNNIYCVDMTKKEEYPITTTGIPNLVFNGIADWVYEARGNDFPEEILGTGYFVKVSPDGQQMVYGSIDDRNVTENVFVKYGKPGDLEYQYAEEVRVRYPKPGTTIPTYKLFHFNFTDRVTKLVSEYRTGRELLFGTTWVTKSMLAVCYANRVQNVTEVDLCELTAGKCRKVAEDRNSRGWSTLELPVFSMKGDRYLIRRRQPVGGDEYYHIHLINVDGSCSVALTNGTFMVTNIDRWDEANKVVYYTASEVGKPSTRHLYSVSESGKEAPVCMSCSMTTPDGEPCDFGTIDFSIDFKHGIGRCSGPKIPFTVSYIMSADNKLKRVEYLRENSEFRKYMEGKLAPKVFNTQITVAKNIEAEVRLYLPPKMDTTGKTKYPMIVYVYGGPDNPQVKDTFAFDWSLYLTTNRSIIYCIIDGRNTGQKGTEMMYAGYRAFGTVEIQDQITAVKYLQEKFDFIDKTRTGIWGWSYGGYATTKVLENDVDGAFKCGVAGAPVTDWIYYNTGYTERYMDLPSGNPKAYRESSTLYNVENLRKKKYLLIHGTGDDNVHFQHAMALVEVLQSKNIMFEQAVYPDQTHSFEGTSKIHMMHTMDKFFEKCFGLSY